MGYNHVRLSTRVKAHLHFRTNFTRQKVGLYLHQYDIIFVFEEKINDFSKVKLPIAFKSACISSIPPGIFNRRSSKSSERCLAFLAWITSKKKNISMVFFVQNNRCQSLVDMVISIIFHYHQLGQLWTIFQHLFIVSVQSISHFTMR